ncbi:acyl-CoA synthetase [Paenibacillus sedimenti]|uniref:acyl-CoA synthetase n=1 Tax=Paenibacillus sedimenti TaxID=2770274 RepID=UPI00289CFD5A|nr:long-chain fatty acid--CoA ligase [Paenibacillus sedimenti]
MNSWETEWFEWRSRMTPDKTAVVDGYSGLSWSYRQLQERTEHLAAALRQWGISKGDRVALLAPNGLCYFELLFACARMGAVLVPLNWRLSGVELGYILDDCAYRLLFYHEELEALAQSVDPGRRISLQSDSYANAGTEGSVGTGEQTVQAPEAKDPLLMIYTGGTTGKPKGVVLSHLSVYANASNTVISWGLTDRDVTVTYLPMFHTGGINALSLPVLLAGGTVVVEREFKPERAVMLLELMQCSVVLMVPTMYHLLVQTQSYREASFRHMRAFISGGAPCPLTIYDAFAAKGLPFKEGYGMTEAGPNNFYIDPADALRKRGSVGRPMICNRIRIMRENGTQAAAGEVGEIQISGQHLFEAYWNNPKATAEACREGWFCTGDLGRYDDEGFYYIVGRKKEMIITGGENVYPLEVEHLLQQHPAVAEAAVIGLPHAKWGELVTAVIALRDGSHATSEELQAYCASRIGKYKVPKKILFVETLPKTPVGKIDKNGLVSAFSGLW